MRPSAAKPAPAPPRPPPTDAGTPSPSPPPGPPTAAKVVVRLRPLTRADGPRAVTHARGRVALAAVPPSVPAAEFDFPDGVIEGDQDAVWEAVEGAVASVARGTCALVAAYGQTGAGKTHTIAGDAGAPGVAPRAAVALAAAAPPGSSLALTAVEVYCDKVRCLLGGARDVAVGTKGGRVALGGAATVAAADGTALAAAMRRALGARATGATAANAASSRSHAVLLVSVAPPRAAGWRAPATLALVDLAGSERADRAAAAGTAAGEGRAINASLAVLGRVVSALAAGAVHVPYRDAALTRVLRDGLGGGAAPTVIVCASPGVVDAGETLGALRFGARARGLDAAVHATVAPSVPPAAGASGGGGGDGDGAAAAALGAARDEVRRLRAVVEGRRAGLRVAVVACVCAVQVTAAAACAFW